MLWSLSLKKGVDPGASVIKHLTAEGVAKQSEAGIKIPGVPGAHTADSLTAWMEEGGEEALDILSKATTVRPSKDEKGKKGKAPEPDDTDEDNEDQESLEDSED